jgi:ATP-binding cassette subfamily B protein
MRRQSALTGAGATGERPGSRELGHLAELWRFGRPYRVQILGTIGALTLAAATVLGLGFGLRKLVDQGFASGNAALLDQAVLVLFGVIVLLAVASYARSYLVSWIGERVVADIRRAVFDRVIDMSPAYYEVTRTGEILSRLTTDTTLLQTVIGTSASFALRNLLLLVGGTALLAVTSAILIYGRRVRRLSSASQDRVADVGAYVDETLGAIRTVQAFGHETIDRRRFAERVEAAFATAVGRIKARAMLTTVVIVLVFAAVSIILWIGGHDVLAGRINQRGNG